MWQWGDEDNDIGVRNFNCINDRFKSLNKVVIIIYTFYESEVFYYLKK